MVSRLLLLLLLLVLVVGSEDNGDMKIRRSMLTHGCTSWLVDFFSLGRVN